MNIKLENYLDYKYGIKDILDLMSFEFKGLTDDYTYKISFKQFNYDIEVIKRFIKNRGYENIKLIKNTNKYLIGYENQELWEDEIEAEFNINLDLSIRYEITNTGYINKYIYIEDLKDLIKLMENFKRFCEIYDNEFKVELRKMKLELLENN